MSSMEELAKASRLATCLGMSLEDCLPGPAPEPKLCTCIECGHKYQMPSRTWHNWSLCSDDCCSRRRARLRPPEDD